MGGNTLALHLHSSHTVDSLLANKPPYCKHSLRCHMSQLLRSIVGDDAVARILNALETDAPDAIALRRTTASGRWINLHTDTAARTLHVSA